MLVSESSTINMYWLNELGFTPISNISDIYVGINSKKIGE